MKIDAVHFVLRRLHGAMEGMEDMDMPPKSSPINWISNPQLQNVYFKLSINGNSELLVYKKKLTPFSA
jgi:hypothetical protein